MSLLLLPFIFPASADGFSFPSDYQEDQVIGVIYKYIDIFIYLFIYLFDM